MRRNPSVDAVLSSLPADAEQQLEVGLHVLRHAFRKKVGKLITALLDGKALLCR